MLATDKYLPKANLEWDVPVVTALAMADRLLHTGQQAANINNTLFFEDWTCFDLGLHYVAVVAAKATTRCSVLL